MEISDLGKRQKKKSLDIGGNLDVSLHVGLFIKGLFTNTPLYLV